MLGYIMAALWGKGKPKPEQFLPKWMKDQRRAARTDDAVMSAFEQMFAMAQEGSDADDFNADGRRRVPH